MDGILTCARYAFAPNYYKYCGPDANQGIASYIKEGRSRCPAKLTDPDAIYRQCRSGVLRNGLCFYHNMLKDKGYVVEKY